jgi:hypothetical protein
MQLAIGNDFTYGNTFDIFLILNNLFRFK